MQNFYGVRDIKMSVALLFMACAMCPMHILSGNRAKRYFGEVCFLNIPHSEKVLWSLLRMTLHFRDSCSSPM